MKWRGTAVAIPGPACGAAAVGAAGAAGPAGAAANADIAVVAALIVAHNSWVDFKSSSCCPFWTS